MPIPPKEIPNNLIEQFTLNHQIPIIDWYIDGTSPEREFQVSLPDGTQASYYLKTTIDSNIEKIKRRETNYYGDTDSWLYEALTKYPISNKEVAIIGSAAPWYESVILAFGGKPTTIEYNHIVTNDPHLEVLTVEQFKKNPKKFDLVISISSIEHDGLGRYGDPINPNGDIEFMLFAKQSLLKEDGYMILAMPVGPDCLYWNAHRIYGILRLPLLLKDWEIVDSFGFEEARLLFGEMGFYGYQPVFYLSANKRSN